MSADDILDRLERFRNTRTFPFYEDSVLREAAAEIVRLRGEVCSCPSGDGSLRWPCKAHPPGAIAPAEAKGDACGYCKGSGEVSGYIEHTSGDPQDAYAGTVPCALCNGTGYAFTPQPADGGAVAEWQVFHPQDGWGATHRDNVEAYRARGIPVRPLYTHPPAAQVQPPAEKPVAWWNGIGEDKTERSPYGPSIRWGAGAENSGHDIPLYAGYNPVHFANPAGDALGAVNFNGNDGDNRRQPQGTTSGGSPDYSPSSHPSACELVAVPPAGCIVVEEASCVPHVHPEYGVGLFFTEDAALQHRGDSRGGEGS